MYRAPGQKKHTHTHTHTKYTVLFSVKYSEKKLNTPFFDDLRSTCLSTFFAVGSNFVANAAVISWRSEKSWNKNCKLSWRCEESSNNCLAFSKFSDCTYANFLHFCWFGADWRRSFFFNFLLGATAYLVFAKVDNQVHWDRRDFVCRWKRFPGSANRQF